MEYVSLKNIFLKNVYSTENICQGKILFLKNVYQRKIFATRKVFVKENVFPIMNVVEILFFSLVLHYSRKRKCFLFLV